MTIRRAMLFVIASLFTAGMTSVASAGCCGWGAPVAYAAGGCGGCGTPSAAAVFAEPVAPALPPVAGWGAGWGTGCACSHRFVYPAVPAATLTPIAPAPIYVVNQGPYYTGPGIMAPYHTWSAGSYVTPGAYPYLHGYGHGYGYWHRYGRWHGYGYGRGYGLHRPFIAPRFAYRRRFYGHPVHRAWRPALHRYYR